MSLNRRDPRFHDLFSLDLASGALDLVEENPGLAGFVTDEAYRAVLALKLATRWRAPGVAQAGRRVGCRSWNSHRRTPAPQGRTTSIPRGRSCICAMRAGATLQPWFGWTVHRRDHRSSGGSTGGYWRHDRGYRDADAARIHRGGRANGVSRARPRRSRRTWISWHGRVLAIGVSSSRTEDDRRGSSRPIPTRGRRWITSTTGQRRHCARCCGHVRSWTVRRCDGCIRFASTRVTGYRWSAT